MKSIIEQVKREIPSVDEIIDLTWEKLKFTKDFVRKNFGKAILKIVVLSEENLVLIRTKIKT
jgi:hypothetical protein